MSSSATGVGMPICFLGAILLILTQKSSQKFGDVLGIMVHLYVIPFPCSHIILFACQTFYHLTYNTFYMTALEHLDIPYILHHSRHVCLSFTLQSNNENSEKQWFSNPVAACCR